MDFGTVKDRSTADPSSSELGGARAVREEAHALFGRQNYKEAMSKVLKLLQAAPDEPDLLLFAAACFFHLKDYKVGTCQSPLLRSARPVRSDS